MAESSAPIVPHVDPVRRGLPRVGGSGILGSVETTPAIQDYLGAIYDLTGGEKPVIGARLARHMHVSAPSITEALRRMQREGYIRLARQEGDPPHQQGPAVSRRRWRAGIACSSAGSPTCSGWTGRAPTRRPIASSTRCRRWWRSASPSCSACRAPARTAIPFPACPPPRRTTRVPLSQALAGQELDRRPHHRGGRGGSPAPALPLGERHPAGGAPHHQGGCALRRDDQRGPRRAAPSPWGWSPPARSGCTTPRIRRTSRPLVPPRARSAPAPGRALAMSRRSRASTRCRTASSGSRRAGSSTASARPTASRIPVSCWIDPHRRRGDPLRHRRLAARGAGPAPHRYPRPLHRRGPARAPAGRARPRARRRGHGRALAPALRPRRRGRISSRTPSSSSQKDEYAYAHYPAAVLRGVLLPEELRPARLSLAPARWGRRARARRDRAPQRRPHPGPSVAARRAARVGAGHPRRRLLLLAAVDRQRDAARRRVGSHPRHALDQAPQDAAPASSRGRIFPSHDPAFWATAIKSPDAYR